MVKNKASGTATRMTAPGIAHCALGVWASHGFTTPLLAFLAPGLALLVQRRDSLTGEADTAKTFVESIAPAKFCPSLRYTAAVM